MLVFSKTIHVRKISKRILENKVISVDNARPISKQLSLFRVVNYFDGSIYESHIFTEEC